MAKKPKQNKVAAQPAPQTKRVFELPLPDSQTSGMSYISLPDQNVPESKKTPQWFADNLNYIISFYNTPVRNVLVPEQVADEANIQFPNSQSPVQKMLRFMLYYLGKQPNLNFNHLTQNVTGSNLQATWIKGQRITQLIDFMKGKMTEALGNMEFGARPLSEKASSERTDVFNKLMFKYDMKDFFSYLQTQGITYKPEGDQDFHFPEQIDQWMDTGYKPYGAELMVDTAKEIWEQNYCYYLFLQSFLHVSITSLTGIEHYVDNGKHCMSLCMPYQLITDTRVDDDYGRKSRFVGVVKTMTPSEIFSRYKQFDETQKQDIMNMAKDQTLSQPYNTLTNLKWWNYTATNKDASIAVVTGYWIGQHDLSTKVIENKYGTKKVIRVDEAEGGDYVMDDIHQCTIIGGKYVLDFGYSTNVVEDIKNKQKPILPILIFRPNMIGGESVSYVERIASIQDELDMYWFKIKEMVGNAKGKRYIVNGAKLGNSTTAKELLGDLSSMGVHVTTTTGETSEADDGIPLIQVVDMTLDPNMQQILALIAKREREIEEITNVSKIAFGQQTTYIGSKTQQTAIGQSSLGQAYMYDGFLDFCQMNIQYGCNVKKLLFAMNDSLEAAVTVGDRGRHFFKITKDFKYEDFLIYLHVKDVIDEQARARILAYAQAWSQNPAFGIYPVDILRLERTSTFSEAISVLEHSLKTHKRDMEAQAKMRAQMAQVSEEKDMAKFAQLESLRQAGQDGREKIKAEAKVKSAVVAANPGFAVQEVEQAEQV
jgi:hypothetical protein